MVLRGSNLAPPTSLQQAEDNLSIARENLRQAKEDFEAVKAATLSTLSTEELVPTNLTKDELVDLVQRLQQQLTDKEKTEKLAELNAERAKSVVVNTLKQLAVGGAAGAIARTSVAPLDRVKILMQTSHLIGADVEAQNKSILQSFRNIVNNEGFFRLWRGNFTNCIRVIPHTATQFVAYDKYKSFLVKDNQEMTVPLRLLAGALSGMTAATVTHPMDVIRIRLQTQPELKGIGDSMKSIYRENGLRTFYKGYTPAMLSLSPFIAINFATMDTLKKMYFGSEDRHLTKRELQKRNPLATLGLGAVSGIFAQTCCYPLDTIRRRMQLKKIDKVSVEGIKSTANYSSMFDAIKRILREEGIKGFYKGMSANALKVVPNNAIRFAAFDFLKTFIMKDTTNTNKEAAWSNNNKNGAPPAKEVDSGAFSGM